jgi:predicted membrane-bound mannosyltransferase
MTKAVYGILVALALVTGLAFRLARLDARPMHHDEANQAVKFGELLEHGDYRYDASDHHGPTLYYLTLPSAWLRGQHTLAALDETTLRLVPACFGVLLLLLMLPLARGLGRPAIVVAMVLGAVSPALV